MLKGPRAQRRPRRGSCAKQPAHPALFPFEHPLELSELFLALFELGGMEVHATKAPAPGNHVMEHLVIDDVSDEISRHPFLVEGGMDPDHPVDSAVAAELDGLTRGLRRGTFAPRDEGVHLSVEVAVVDFAEELEQIMVPALRDQGRASLSPREPKAVGVDVVAKCCARLSVPTRNVADEGVDDRRRSVRSEEHTSEL